MITIRLGSPVPLADQIQAALREAIATGQLAVGDPLPTVRQLGADLGIHFNTVARAYRALEARGLIAAVRGRGSIVISNVESPVSPQDRAREELVPAVRKLLTDARVAGIDGQAVIELIRHELARFGPPGALPVDLGRGGQGHADRDPRRRLRDLRRR